MTIEGGNVTGSHALHPWAIRLRSELEFELGPRIQIPRDDSQGWYAIEEASTTNAFLEVKVHELRLVPFAGEQGAVNTRPYVIGLERAWTENDRELIIDLRRVSTDQEFAEIKGFVLEAFRYWAEPSEVGSAVGAKQAIAEAAPMIAATGLTAELSHVGSISFSHANSRFPVVTRLALRDANFSGSANVKVRVTLSCVGREMAEPWEVVIPKVGAEPVEFEGSQVQLVLHPLAFAEIDERQAGEFKVEVSSDTGAQFSKIFPVDIVAYNQWQLIPDDDRMQVSLAALAPFVQPNQPAVEDVLRRARDILEANTGTSSTEGYQAGAGRAVEITAAIYYALQERRISYSNPPASWDAQTQKVRLVPDVLGANVGSGVGTCLDTTITFASCLAAAGLFPVLVLITGHAFVGVMTGKQMADGSSQMRLSSTVVTDVSVFTNLVEGGFLLPVETTVLTDADSVSFDQAIDQARKRMAGAAFRALSDRSGSLSAGGFVGAIDVSRAHQAGLQPLPAVIRKGDVVEIVEYKAFTPPDFTHAASVARKSSSGHVIKDDSPGRIQNWKRALLDLSANNPLLKLPARDTVARALIPPGSLAKLEDFIHAGGVLRLHPLDGVTPEDLARGVKSIAQLHAEDLAARLFRDQLLFLNYSSDTYLSRLRGLARKARVSLEESGSTSLFAGIGLLKWELEGKPMESPLILAPVRLMGGTARNKIFELSLDESGTSTPNFCLLEKLDEEFGIKIPGLREPEEDGYGIDVDKALQSVREAILKSDLGFTVEEGLVLGNFQFSTFRIWKDVDEHWSRFVEAPVVKHLVEKYNEDYPRPENPEYPPVNLPLPADESQYEAIQAAIAGETFVLEGPPGTGKSQTIANIIAGAMATGKRVLFVAEKPAALEVVKQRLDAVGVGAFSLDLHGRTRKRSEVAAAIREALEVQTGVDRVEVDTIKTELRSNARELDRYAEVLHRVDDVGYSIWTARQRLLAAGDGPALEIELEGLTLGAEKLAAIRQALEDFPDTARLAVSSESQPWLLAGDNADIAAVRGALERFLQLIDVLPTSHPVIGAAIQAAMTVDDFETLLRLIEQPLPAVHIIDQVRTPGWEHLYSNWREQILSKSTVPPSLVPYRPDILQAPLEEWLQQAQTAAASGIFGRKKKLAEAALPLAPFALDGAVVEPDRLIELLTEFIAFRTQAADLRSSVAAAVPGMDLPVTWHPYAGAGVVDMDKRRDELVAIGRLLTDETEAGRALRAIPGQVVSIDQVTAANLSMVAEGWRRLLDALGTDAASVDRWQSGRPLVRAWTESREGWRADMAEGFRKLQRIGNLHAGLKSLSDAGLHAAVAQLVNGDISAFDALSAFERGLARASLDRAWSAGSLGGFDAETHDVRVHRFATADARWRKAQSAVIPDLAASGRPFAPGTVTGQVGELLREVSKVRGGKPLRYLLEHYHQTLSSIMPCFLMSPESVAQFLRPGLFTFDLVIIDEASQVRVAEAVGALGRANSAVIVGDSKQMPPTSFGGSRLVDADWDPYAEVAEVPQDEESILTECIRSRIPKRWLAWHYRSQAEGLIAFSNAKYYEGRLASFPTPNDVDPRMGLRFSYVQDGQFLRSAKGAQLRTNPVEAAVVVADIQRRLNDPIESKNSIGVVTFNAQQQALIDSMLLDAEDERIREAYNREGDTRLFVKNLENVQGDERDVILFSIGYSKDENGRLPLQWGPLNTEGGERRLNVAVTRARKQVVVFASFQPEDIDLNRTGSKAIEDLKNYLLIARDGVESNAALIARKPGEIDRHRNEIATALRAAGLSVEEDRGLSDFRVDLVVAPADDPGRPSLAILLDGPRWSRGKRTQDRDVVPVEVLGNLMGWPDVMRVWLPDWIRDSGDVVERIRRRTHDAHTQLIERIKTADMSPPPIVETAHVEAPPVSFEPTVDVAPESMLSSEIVPDSSPVGEVSDPEDLGDKEPVSDESSSPSTAVAPDTVSEDGNSWPPVAGRNEEEAATEASNVFVAAHANVIGSRTVLDALPDRGAANSVREQLLDVVEAEGPIEIGRLVRIVGRRFNLNKVSKTRADDIARLIPRNQLVRSRKFGDFAWPARLDPETWKQFRVADTEVTRSLDEVAPEEIANAMAYAKTQTPDVGDVDQILKKTADLFGINRLGANVRARLEAVYELSASSEVEASTGGSPLEV